jgi:hypothetical protein
MVRADRYPDQRQLGGQCHVLGERRLAARERSVPVEAKRRAVDRAAEDDVDPLPAVGVDEWAADGPFESHRLRAALDREVAVDDDVGARDLDRARRESQLGGLLSVEELGREQVCREVLVHDLEAVGTRRARQLRRSILSEREGRIEGGERGLEGAGHVGEREADARVHGVELPGAGPEDLLRCCQSVHLSSPFAYTCDRKQL